MSRILTAGALALLLPLAAQAQTTTRTLSNGDVVTNQRSDINGLCNDQRSVTTPYGASTTNNRTVGNGGAVDTRTSTNGAGGVVNSTHAVGGGGYTAARQCRRRRAGCTTARVSRPPAG